MVVSRRRSVGALTCLGLHLLLGAFGDDSATPEDLEYARCPSESIRALVVLDSPNPNRPSIHWLWVRDPGGAPVQRQIPVPRVVRLTGAKKCTRWVATEAAVEIIEAKLLTEIGWHAVGVRELRCRDRGTYREVGVAVFQPRSAITGSVGADSPGVRQAGRFNGLPSANRRAISNDA